MSPIFIEMSPIFIEMSQMSTIFIEMPQIVTTYYKNEWQWQEDGSVQTSLFVP